MITLLTLLACAEPETPVDAPTVAWLVPSDGDVLTGVDIASALVIEGFSLQDPAKHSEGAPIGHVVVRVDGAEALQVGTTNFTVTVDPGDHTLEAALFYADGDAVEAADGLLCDEGEDGCAAVSAAIDVTVQ